MPDQEMAYVGRKACGCVSWVGVDAPDLAHSNGDSVLATLKAGGTVERITVEQAHRLPLRFGPCAHERGAQTVARQQMVLEA